MKKARPHYLAAGALLLATAAIVIAYGQMKARTTAETPAPPPPTAEDIAALSRAMHGAAEQQPLDAPKDAYGNPYIIGDLGGYPVNLPSSVVSLLEYDDSPGWDREKLRNYQPPVRNYQSIIDSFSFRMRYRDQTLLDTRKNYAQYKREIEMLPNPWIRVGIASGTRYHQGEHIWDRYIASDFERGYSSDSPVYQRDGDDYEFGLERYIVPGINPANNLPWRENHSADDVFVHRDAAGHVNAYIRCSNNAVPHPPCSHYFSVSGDMKVDASLLYDRQLLPDWQKIQQAADSAIHGFVVTTASR